MSSEEEVPLRQYIQVLFEEYRRGHIREHELLERALMKAESSMNQRLEGMNEFRAQLDKQQGTFVTKAEFEAAMRPLQKFNDRLGGMAAGLLLLSGLLTTLIVLLLRK